ncbi:uncharacterized protein METZ01_LOCUS186462, partial [marine metagenome]
RSRASAERAPTTASTSTSRPSMSPSAAS